MEKYDITRIKQRFGIIGNAPELIRSIDIAVQVAPTDLSVLISGESGVGKEVLPQIIHQFSSRKHGVYIAVNCGAIPEGTIDSELFGHEKGSFTGAYESRKGYFEVANNGTIFLDEVAELPLSTQVRLLRVLETGEFIRVGSSKVIKTDVRVIAATNVDIQNAIQKGNFREDLFYRLSSVPIEVPPLRHRKEDIPILFRKFAVDFAERNRMPSITLTEEAMDMLINYRWPGNIRQLKNIVEQISIIEEKRLITADVMRTYLPDYNEMKLPALYDTVDQKTFATEREILYKILFDMRNDVNELKKLVHNNLLKDHSEKEIHKGAPHVIPKVFEDIVPIEQEERLKRKFEYPRNDGDGIQDTQEIVEESLSLADKEIELIRKALEKHHGKRKHAAGELGISERTLYRKIKEYNIE
ncbi:MAG: sigma-54-dependent Fis family transcriptional regulator [Bacteroidales bacterium]|nr:sigma-54-dependent Fis family transcriptional regulator [Bacteroidales bacterium]